ncbi:hypothetical protein ACWFMI_23695 [Nocardiopsis terrae]|uniref:hypothetical protein n=1 Tax=Streptomyces sp. NPDC057554 TaxID=3350538 RepID=UPI0036A1A257
MSTSSTFAALPVPGEEIAPYKIEAGCRVAITYKNGYRVAGKARARTQAYRFGWYLTVDRFSGGSVRCESSDIATLQYLG